MASRDTPQQSPVKDSTNGPGEQASLNEDEIQAVENDSQPHPDASGVAQAPATTTQTPLPLELSDQDYEDVCKAIGDIAVSKLRMALQSAVYISPMLLLSDSKIYRWNWSQIDILKVIVKLYLWNSAPHCDI